LGFGTKSTVSWSDLKVFLDLKYCREGGGDYTKESTAHLERLRIL